ncbi:diacylglycerol kinase (ATP) [Rhodoblastus acidophilus]|uniref:diacylglycerol kinase n=1 Tax=Rhodoblastus acidophilus TaxID=1074 RepID=UPI002224B72E|nr:diacylglycerol kinase [Rhodoblastus acidophilus]MCW2316547.1 diacylglycerol kinase (ATP) [Rhodoblastus acidophilus]
MSALLQALLNSLAGLRAALRSERAFRQEMILLVLAIPAALALTGDPVRRALLIGGVLALMSVELLNTAIEKLCDHVTPEKNGEIRDIKDMGSAAVFCALILAALLWGAALADSLGRAPGGAPPAVTPAGFAPSPQR